MTTEINRTGEIEIRLNRARRSVAGITASSVSAQTLDISQFAASKTIAVVQRDFELLVDLLKKYPSQMAEITDWVIQGKMFRAHELAEKIGLTEKRFVKEGGGFPFLFWVIVIGVLFLEHD